MLGKVSLYFENTWFPFFSKKKTVFVRNKSMKWALPFWQEREKTSGGRKEDILSSRIVVGKRGEAVKTVWVLRVSPSLLHTTRKGVLFATFCEILSLVPSEITCRAKNFPLEEGRCKAPWNFSADMLSSVFSRGLTNPIRRRRKESQGNKKCHFSPSLPTLFTLPHTFLPLGGSFDPSPKSGERTLSPSGKNTFFAAKREFALLSLTCFFRTV